MCFTHGSPRKPSSRVFFMKLFKIKPELTGLVEFFSAASEVFGRFSSCSFSDDDSWATWDIHHLGEVVTIEISHARGDEFFQVRYRVDRQDKDVSLLRPRRSDFFSWSMELWDAFMQRAGKPWSEWTEDEIMSSTMWCRYFVEAGNQPTGTIHTMMVLKSYENPDDPHVKGYFRCLAGRK